MEKTKITANQIIEIAQKMFDEIPNFREQKIKHIIDFFGIKDTTDLTDVIVAPMLYQTFKECFGDVIDVLNSDTIEGFGFNDDEYFQFFNFPKLNPFDRVLNISKETGESYEAKYYQMNFSSGYSIPEPKIVPLHPKELYL